MYEMFAEQHMIVVSPGLFVHVLDIGPNHEPCCHIVLGNETQTDIMKVNVWISLYIQYFM